MVLKKNRILSCILCTLLAFSLTSCEYITSILNPEETTGAVITTSPSDTSRRDEETLAPGESETIDPGEPITLPNPDIEKNFINPLTGLPCEDDLSSARALAFVIDNNYLSFPQSGLNKVDVICEFVLPSGETELLAITKDPANAASIGPLGTLDSVMLDFASGFDAIAFSRNVTETVKAALESSKTPFFAYELNKPSFGFFESSDRKNQYGYAYSVMAEGVRLLAAVSSDSVSSTSASTFSQIFDFYEGEREYTASGQTAANVYIPASRSQHVQLVYSESTKMYYRYAFGTKQQTDAVTGEPAAFKNLLLLSGSERTATETGETDSEESATVLGQRGEGYFVTCGKYINITWVRNSDGAFRFYRADGTTFEMPAGNVYMSFVSEALLGQINLNYKR